MEFDDFTTEQHIDAAYNLGAKHERFAIVKWLRKVANMNPQSPEAKAFVLLLCKAVEAREHQE